MVIDDRRREWLENLRALRRKKEKELKELEEKKKKELEEAEEMLQAGVEELTAEEEEILERLRRKIPALREIAEETAKKEEIAEGVSLEETVAKEKVSEEAKEKGGPIYGAPIEETLAAVYQRSDYNIYNELKGTLEKVQRGEYLSQTERNAFYKRQEEFERFNQEIEADPLFLQDKDPYEYINRSKQAIDSIEKQLSQYKT